MKKLISAMLLLGACRTTTVVVPSPRQAGVQVSGSGAADATAAVRQFLAAAKSQDLAAFALVWGTKSGPARDAIPREELEKRELILMKCLAHDSFDILGDAPATDGRRAFAIQLRRRDLTGATNFYAVAGPSGRWYVESYEPEPLLQRDFCRS